ncbi:MAG TPA: HAD family hydrolase [Ktedonobacteraceae bacterium]|nr:HAD family hydrolase [Ktedonobacteraceae bacterium]
MIQALIFDFDGLILDTEISAYQSWQEIYQEHHCHFPLEKWANRIGGAADLFDPCEYLETLLQRPVERQVLRDRRRQRHLELIAQHVALPGVEEYLADGRHLGLKIGVASSSTRAWVSEHLSRLGLLDYFDALRCGDSVTHKKPHPELYRAALNDLGVAADRAIALEDSPNGVRAAQRAGIFCVAVPNVITGQLLLDHADLRLSSLADMPLADLIAEVEKRRSVDHAVS